MGGRLWSEAELAYIRENYANASARAIAIRLGRPIRGVYNAAHKLGVQKSEGFMRTIGFQKGSGVGAEFRYSKGHVPANKGTRRPGWAAGRMKETQFKKGSRPHTWKPVGTILADGEGYLRIKVRERQPGDPAGWRHDIWPLLHHKVWIEHNGPVPPKHLVVFKDRDRSNCAIENLELISKAENARRNRMWARYPRGLAMAIHQLGQLKRRIKNRDAKEHNQGPSGPPIRDARAPQG